MSPSHFKDYVLTLEPAGHQSESIKQSINCKKKRNYCHVSSMEVLFRPHKGLAPSDWHRKQSADFVWRKKDERELSPNRLSNIYIVLPLEICQNSGKSAQASSLQKKQIPLVQVQISGVGV